MFSRCKYVVFVCVLLLLLIKAVVNVGDDNYLKKRGQIIYVNPKYIKDAYAFTSRRSRNEPYLTNLTATTLVEFNNNVTIQIRFHLMIGSDFDLKYKVCDAMKVGWVNDFLKQSDFKTECPMPPGPVGFINMRLPPKNLPIPVLGKDHQIDFSGFVTGTKEEIFHVTIMLNVDPPRKRTQTKH